MHCNRLTHFVRINANGTFSVCGHMHNSYNFDNYDDIKNHSWIRKLHSQFTNNSWPDECVRCKLSEDNGDESIRIHFNKLHSKYYSINPEYIVLGGILDNKCNSACQTCGAMSSSLIGKLEGKTITIDNYEKILPLLSHVVQLDINGGEPTISSLYKKVLMQISPSTNIRLNTNAITFFSEIDELLNDDRYVTITMSLDGINKIYEYIRWPAKWNVVTKVHEQYKKLSERYANLELNFWVTLNALNIGDYYNIKKYSDGIGIPYSYGILQTPEPLNIKYKNVFTAAYSGGIGNNLVASEADNNIELTRFLETQDKIRNISYKDYYDINI